MPITAKRRALYPATWNTISAAVRFGRAQGRCECTGACGDHHLSGRCEERHGQPAESFAGTVWLATAHLDHDPRHNAPSNLAALCQRCHIRLDRHEQAASRAQTRHRKRLGGAVQLRLALPLPGPPPVTGLQLGLFKAPRAGRGVELQAAA